MLVYFLYLEKKHIDFYLFIGGGGSMYLTIWLHLVDKIHSCDDLFPCQ